MAWMLAHRDSYSPAETRLDAGIHVAGLVLVGLGVPVLLAIAFVVARQDGDVRPLWACGVYGLALVAMIGGFGAVQPAARGAAGLAVSTVGPQRDFPEKLQAATRR